MWGLQAAESADAVRLRGTAALPYIISLEQGAPAILSITFRGPKLEIGAERFAVENLGFKVSDRTRHMTFVRCNRKHHCLAYARAGFSSLNHVAFDMPSLESVMRGIGRPRDAGYPVVWGPGRHGPGNNVFGYFVGPHGGVVEYTSEVSEVDESYKVGGPEDWKWPPGRIDHWGISTKDAARISEAERAYRWLS